MSVSYPVCDKSLETLGEQFARDESSRMSTMEQCFESSSARESAYNCTVGERCARRFSNAAIALRALQRSISTLAY